MAALALGADEELFNLGNHRTESLMRFIEVIGVRARVRVRVRVSVRVRVRVRLGLGLEFGLGLGLGLGLTLTTGPRASCASLR